MLATDGGENHVAYAVRTDLACEVNLNRGVYGHGIGVHPDEGRVVGHAHIIKYTVLVVVDELVHMPGA